MHNEKIDINADFQWRPQPAAAAVINALITGFLDSHATARAFAARLLNETGTRFSDWIDHLAVPSGADLERRLRSAGFADRQGAGDSYDGRVWLHLRGLFPTVVTHDKPTSRLAIRAESIEAFCAASGLDEKRVVLGDALAALRKALVAREGESELWIAERHGWQGWQVPAVDAQLADKLCHHRDVFASRQRTFENDANGFERTLELVHDAVRDIGVDRACDLFFAAEREYWQSRNHAARIQRSRQDALGMGWANHDHHTYRSSRKHFADLITVLEALGCKCRERFYAGGEAGWGAQVLEQPASGVVIFADVDLTPEELSGDFAHQPLPPRGELGTVGLWCELHGEAFLQAGMHHLECRFDFDAATQQLAAAGVDTMAPFTDFEYLKQAFTQGEIWKVEPQRIDSLLADGLITQDQAEQFRLDGALGSHLEILQRNDGFKGFNQTGVSQIIRKTDPRR